MAIIEVQEPESTETTGPFYRLTREESLAKLRVNANKGLTTKEADIRLANYGLNQLPAGKSKTILERLWAQMNSAIIYVVLIGAILSFGFGHIPDGIVILSVTVVNIVVGLLMEGKAANTTKKLKSMMSPTALVLRDEERKQIDSHQVVVGDIFFLQPGDIVPADGRILACTDLNVLEAALTGEPHPIVKTVAPIVTDAPLAERFCMVFSGTQIIKGTATCLAVHTGRVCEMGKISGLLHEVDDMKTPLVEQLEKFGGKLSIAILIIAVIALAVALARSYDVGDAFSFAIAIAIAAIPEGLPSCVTVTFAIGVYNMAQKRAVVKSLPAVETLGSVSVICSDKTGTLTINIMTVKALCTANLNIHDVADNGLVITAPEEEHPQVMKSIFAGVFCNDSSILLSTNETAISLMDVEHGPDTTSVSTYTVQGDPTEACLLSLAAHNYPAIEVREWIRRFPRIGEVPFDSATKFMATMHTFPLDQLRRWLEDDTIVSADKDENTVTVVCVKGAPEKVTSFCTTAGPAQQQWITKAGELASRGMRVLGMAYAIVPKDTNVVELMAANPTNFTMLSLAGIMDPPRAEAITAVRDAQQAGITVKMITGDHPMTATAIGKMLGLNIPEGSHAVTGADLDRLINHQEEFDQVVMINDVFARTTPEHKLRIVQSLQRQGRVCSMTGDGVNDAPALKAANIGVAMGITGTEVAKDAANMIITDDNFATIVHAIRVGRCTYNNLVKILAFVLPTNGGQAFSIIMALIIGFDVPITALQILWANMITSIALGLVLAFEPAHDSIMTLPPRRPNKFIFGRFLTWRVIFVSALLTIAVIGSYQFEKSRLGSTAKLRTIATNTLCMGQATYLFNCRNLRRHSSPKALLSGNRIIFLGIGVVGAFQAIFTYASPFQFVFHSAALDGQSWGWIFLWAVLIFIVVELEKSVAKLKMKLCGPCSRYQLPEAHHGEEEDDDEHAYEMQ
eukprot:scaffold5350_cov178-Ochromonas_danica.AAC.4